MEICKAPAPRLKALNKHTHIMYRIAEQYNFDQDSGVKHDRRKWRSDVFCLGMRRVGQLIDLLHCIHRVNTSLDKSAGSSVKYHCDVKKIKIKIRQFHPARVVLLSSACLSGRSYLAMREVNSMFSDAQSALWIISGRGTLHRHQTLLPKLI